MSEHVRGKIKHHDRALQLRDYSGLNYGKITPSDIDGILEFSDRLFVLMEFKSFGAPFELGQRLCFERLVHAIAYSKRKAVALLAEHDTAIGEEIDCAKAIVKEFFEGGQWHKRKNDGRQVTVREFIDFYHQTYVLKACLT
jgi:hypothetical protein